MHFLDSDADADVMHAQALIVRASNEFDEMPTLLHLKALYKDTVMDVGTLAATPFSQMNRSRIHARIAGDVQHLKQAVTDRLMNVFSRVHPEEYQLQVLLMHLVEIRSSMDRLE